MPRRAAFFPRFLICAALFGSALRAAAAPHDTVDVPPVKTSIYVGSVTLSTAAPLRRENGGYVAEYRAKVFPFFFMSERGRMRIDFSDEQLARLAGGERVDFTGSAENIDGEPRVVSGHAEPDAAAPATGKLKVRIAVSPKIVLVFNTTYRFIGPP